MNTRLRLWTHRDITPPPRRPAWAVTLMIALGSLVTLAAPTLAAPAPAAQGAAAEAPRSMSAGELQLAIERLSTVGSVLYVAAHPDDENTRLLGWLVGARGVRAGYLSLTRGDGGQNLVGDERGDLLGVIRTHELLAARGIDGAEQHFTRAVDFGYSKTHEETLRVWGKAEVLRDVVAVVRRFRPDVIVTRFSSKGGGHGHHTASAVLAAEAFAKAADPAYEPDQVKRWGTWQATRLYENKSTWRLPEGADVSMYMQADVGGYEPRLGTSWGEIAARSRTQHKSQGFGSVPRRGPAQELFVDVAGDAAPSGTASADPLFEGIDLSWGRFGGTERLMAALRRVQDGFDPARPEACLPGLAAARAEVVKLPDTNRWKARKLAELEATMVAAAGLWVDAQAGTAAVVPGADLEVELQVLLRRPAKVSLESIEWSTGPRTAGTTRVREPLTVHTPTVKKTKLTIPKGAEFSTPYWLREGRLGAARGLHRISDPERIGEPDGPPAIRVTATFTVEGAKITVQRPLLHRWKDRVRGELTRRVEVLPPVTGTPEAEVLMLPGKAQTLAVTLRAHADDQSATARVVAPRGWKVTPPRHKRTLAKAGDEAIVHFEVRPPSATAAPTDLRVEVSTRRGGPAVALGEHAIDHDHLPQQTVLLPATVRAVPVALAVAGKRIGYIPGAGDEVAARLQQVGFEVTLLDPETLAKTDLKGLDAIVTGIRAFNVHPRLFHVRQRLLDWVAEGGTLLAQYNTNNRWTKLPHPLGPAPFEIDRGRVTDETAPLEALDASHAVLTTPNRLGPGDFEGWVQERGLYFAKTWDDSYTPIFESRDPGEPAERGALLVTAHGKGAFIYSGLSFFRQLPAGVPGAYRLLANLLAYRGR